MTASTRSRAAVWTLAFLSLASVAFALFSARSQLGDSHVTLVFLLIVLGSSAAGGRILGLMVPWRHS